MSKIVNGLYIGGKKEAQDLDFLEKNNIKFILNCCPSEFRNDIYGIEYMHLNLKDTHSQNILIHLDKACTFVINSLLCGGNILVHCYSGRSRSSSIIIYTLSKLYNITPEKAYNILKKKHPKTSPNSSFMKQLNIANNYKIKAY